MAKQKSSTLRRQRLRLVRGEGSMTKVKLCAEVDSDMDAELKVLQRKLGNLDDDQLIRLALDLLEETVSQAEFGRYLSFVDHDRQKYRTIDFEEIEAVRLQGEADISGQVAPGLSSLP